MKVTVKLEGLADLEGQLIALGGSVGKGVLRRVGRKALEPFDAAWRANAGPFRLSGQLEESGGVGTKLTKSQRKVQERGSTVEIYAGPGGVPQAIQKEFGNVRSPAEPFVRPAWDATKQQVLDGVADGLGVEIMKAAKRKAKREAKAAAASEGEG